MTKIKWAAIGALLCALVLPYRLNAQEGVGDVVYVPTPQAVVDQMLRMAKVGPGDFVIDLGSGDGRIVLTAVSKFNASGGFGVDLDKVLLKMSNDSAQHLGIADRAKFYDQDLFQTDLSKATVVTSYLLPEMNERLLPKLLSLKPGTRVVAHDYGMGNWRPDQETTLSVPTKTVGNPGVSYVYLYIVPAKVAGEWRSQIPGGKGAENWDFKFTQRFQVIDGTASDGEQTATLQTSAVHTDRLDIVAFMKAGDNSTRHEFIGTVKGDVIQGTMKVGDGSNQRQVPWTANLVQRAATTP